MRSIKCECGGIGEKILTSTDLKAKGRTVVVNNVPAFKCRDCGEIYFNVVELARIEKKLQKGVVPAYA